MLSKKNQLEDEENFKQFNRIRMIKNQPKNSKKLKLNKKLELKNSPKSKSKFRTRVWKQSHNRTKPQKPIMIKNQRNHQTATQNGSFSRIVSNRTQLNKQALKNNQK